MLTTAMTRLILHSGSWGEHAPNKWLRLCSRTSAGYRLLSPCRMMQASSSSGSGSSARRRSSATSSASISSCTMVLTSDQ